MSRFNTGNPLGSGDPRDLDDNAKNMDLAVNSAELSWRDRFQQIRLTYAGMQQQFSLAQDDREQRFNTFISSSGYQFLGDYEAGIEITEYNQLVRDANGEFWRLSGQIELPYTTTGAGMPEDDALVPAGDAVLRQDLANPARGADMVYGARSSEYRLVADRTGGTDSSPQFDEVPPGLAVFLPSGTYRISSGVNISGNWQVAAGTRIVPDSGVTVRVNAGTQIRCEGESPFDTSAAGAFAFEAGVQLSCLIPDGSGDTAGASRFVGHPNSLFAPGSGSSFWRGGTASFPHTVGTGCQLTVIGGGYDNHLHDGAIAAGILSGAHHNISGSHGTIAGGAYQDVRGSYGFVGSGQYNIIHSSFSVVAGGQQNESGDPDSPDTLATRSCFTGGGAQNKAKGLRSSVVGGFQNLASGAQSFVGGGQGGQASGTHSVVTGGLNGLASGDYSGALWGSNCVASGNYSGAGGTSHATGVFSFSFGDFNIASAPRSSAMGGRARAYLDGQRALANGSFSTQGDRQTSELVASRATTGPSSATLGLFGGNQPITLPDNTTWAFKIRVVARQTSAPDGHAAWEISGLIKRDAGAATTAIVGATSKTPIAASGAASSWDMDVDADTANGALRIIAVPNVSATIRWVARVELVEVGG